MRVQGGIVRALLAMVVVVGGSLLASGTGLAHTDIDFTLPTDGAAVGEPVAEITVGFNDPVTLIGPGFEVLDPQGNILTPFVVTDDDMVFRLQLDPPIGGGEAAVRYEVRADDGHTISGGFSFTISVDAPTTTTITVAPSTTVAPTTPDTTTPDTTTPETTSPVASSTPTTADVPTTSTETTSSVAGPAGEDDDGSATTIYLVVAGAVAVAAAALLLLRSRSMRAG